MKKRTIVIAGIAALFMSFAPVYEAVADTLPESYRTEEVTSVKNQSGSNMCWGFASVSAMETELMKNNGADETIDLSEAQLAYFMEIPVMDKLGQHTKLVTKTYIEDVGSSSKHLAALLASGVSPVAEEEISVAAGDMAKMKAELDTSLAYTGEYYLKESNIMQDASTDEIKRAIMKYGSVVISYRSVERSYYNFNTYGWYNPNNSNPDHAVCIVGWDDTYSKENFLVAPEGDGAWIIKNSWGKEWHDEGYFYLSYYDAPLAQSDKTVFDMEYGQYAENIYQNVFLTDNVAPGEGNVMRGRYSKVSNVFTAHANSSGGEELKGVSIFTHEPAEYVIKVYKNVRENVNPESGTLAATLKGEFAYAGFNIIPLEEPLYLSEGESFSIVVTMTNEKGEQVGVAEAERENTLPTFGQSFVCNEGGYWQDYVECSGGNLCIKAYTDNVKKDPKAKIVSMKETIPEMEGYRPADIKWIKSSYSNVNSMVLSWDKGQAEYYVVYQYNDKAGTWQKIGFTNENYYKVTGLSANTKYTFGVKAVAQREGAKSSYQPYYESLNFAKVSAKTAKGKSITQKLVVLDGIGNAVSWTKVSGATKYEVYVMSADTDYEWVLLKSIKATATKKVVQKDVVAGQTYGYRILAYKDDEVIYKGTPMSCIYE